MQNPIIIEGKTFKPNQGYGRDALVLRGPQEWIIRHCEFTAEDLQPHEYDELLDISGGAKVHVEYCDFKGAGKAILIGNSSEDADKENTLGLTATFKYNRFTGNCRRQVYSHCGGVFMDSNIVENWGLSDTWDEKCYGTRCGPKGRINLSNMIYIQPSILTFMNYKSLSDIKTPMLLGPGFRRAAYSDDQNGIKATNCYKNHWWMHIENCESYMAEQDAMNLYQYIVDNLAKGK